jgi:hypothetical protein
MINPPDKSESQNQANENPVDSKFTRDALKEDFPMNIQHSTPTTPLRARMISDQPSARL